MSEPRCWPESDRSAEPTRIQVSAERPYEVLVGHGLLGELPGLLGDGVQRVAVIHPPALIGTAARVVTALRAAGLEPTRIDVPDAEAAKTADGRGPLLVGPRGERLHPLGRGGRAGRRGHHRSRRLRRRDLAARGTAGHRPDHRPGHGRRGGGRQDRDQHPRGQEPGRLLLRAGRGGVRPRPARDAGAGPTWSPVWPRSSSAGSSPTRRSSTMIEADPAPRPGPDSPLLRELVERSIAVKAAGRLGRPAGVHLGRDHGRARAAELRSHPRSRHRAAGALPLAARRGDQRRHGLRRRAGPPGGPARRRDGGPARRDPRALGLPTAYPPDAFDDLLATMALDKKTRGSQLRFVILERTGQRRDPGRPGRAAAAGRLRRGGRLNRASGRAGQPSQTTTIEVL